MSAAAASAAAIADTCPAIPIAPLSALLVDRKRMLDASGAFEFGGDLHEGLLTTSGTVLYD